jgi:hypothetical protein
MQRFYNVEQEKVAAQRVSVQQEAQETKSKRAGIFSSLYSKPANRDDVSESGDTHSQSAGAVPTPQSPTNTDTSNLDVNSVKGSDQKKKKKRRSTLSRMAAALGGGRKQRALSVVMENSELERDVDEEEDQDDEVPVTKQASTTVLKSPTSSVPKLAVSPPLASADGSKPVGNSGGSVVLKTGTSAHESPETAASAHDLTGPTTASTQTNAQSCETTKASGKAVVPTEFGSYQYNRSPQDILFEALQFGIIVVKHGQNLFLCKLSAVDFSTL